MQVKLDDRVGQDFEQPAVMLFAGPKGGGSLLKSHHRPDPRQKFSRGQCFGQVIIGTRFQAINLAGNVGGQAGNQDDEDVLQIWISLDLPANLHPAKIGQYDIQQHQIRAPFTRRQEALPTG